MNKLVIATLFALTATAAQAQTSWSSQQLGPFTNYQSDDGWTGQSQQLGPFTNSQFQGPNGQTYSCQSQRLGSFTTTNCY